MLPYLLSSATLTLCLLFSFADASCSASDQISIDCGSTATSIELDGREWLGDHGCPRSSFLSIKGQSAVSASATGELWQNIDSVPYRSARISVSQFSYYFQLNPGQKFIRLHFNPSSYYGDKRFKDLFTVEAGPFILLRNYSPSMTAHALGQDTFAKEFCITIQENQPLSIVFTPAAATSPSRDKFYAFINGIEILSVPSAYQWQKSIVYIDNTTGLELVHQHSIRRDFDDVRGMFGMWATIHKEKENEKNITWNVTVDVGFSYLVRFHFCELGMKLAEALRKDIILGINHEIFITGADILDDREDKGIPLYKNYMVTVKGNKPEVNRNILISLHSKDVIAWGGSGILEGFEIFKLSNEANSLAGPASNSWPPTQESPSWTFQSLFSFLGYRNSVATAAIVLICLLNIITNKLLRTWEFNSCEEENRLPIKGKQPLCRFSLREILSATDYFYEGFVIGKGGFGIVYKGFIDDRKQSVAIKRLKADSSQGKHEFWTEVETLSVLQHVNLVSLIGYCNELREMILVYEYLPSGTLADHLYKFGRKNKICFPLSWKQRLKICIGVGRGLDYLHTGHGIIHRDIKTSNILLDENFVPKVSDFGLAKIESQGELQRQASIKGTIGYLDPDYLKTCALTMKSDTYSFGVLLLEVLCGKPAVDNGADEDKRILTMWAQDYISKGEFHEIIDPYLTEEISHDSLTTFVRVAERCLHDEPKKRPAIAHVIINLEFALEQQENGKTLSLNGLVCVPNAFPCTQKAQQDDANALLQNVRDSVADDKAQQGDANSMLPNEIASVADDVVQQDNRDYLEPDKIAGTADALPCTDQIQKESPKPLLHNMITNMLTCNDKTIVLSRSTEHSTYLAKEHLSSKVISAGKKDGRKTITNNLLRMWPWYALRNTAKQSKDTGSISNPVPTLHGMSTMALKGSASFRNRINRADYDFRNARIPTLHVFAFSELKTITKHFSNVIGEGGFGTVHRGCFDKKCGGGKGNCGSCVAVKRMKDNAYQGINEWQNEVEFLGLFSHPNLVELLGYCQKEEERYLVYEYMPRSSLDLHLYKSNGGTCVEPLGWNDRIKILFDVACALAYLHESGNNVIHRNVKSATILLDQSNHAKLSGFGFAKWGPVDDFSHVSTRVMGTNCYAAPDYVSTGFIIQLFIQQHQKHVLGKMD
ncbi:putative receptor-like protein kinase At5g39000 [Andrographis paniculata]|uniref:putative receptor-like protein kinase At5g39000 n=1 Tax=Andrographis paniculata TaxID=175694 RepID=UPI0021E71217|nr:putative receptor-like protein kinase At5g39000 [Andrographis paniculata]